MPETTIRHPMTDDERAEYEDLRSLYHDANERTPGRIIVPARLERLSVAAIADRNHGLLITAGQSCPSCIERAHECFDCHEDHSGGACRTTLNFATGEHESY